VEGEKERKERSRRRERKRKRGREREEGEGEGKEKGGRWPKGERGSPTFVLPWSGPAQWFPVPFLTLFNNNNNNNKKHFPTS